MELVHKGSADVAPASRPTRQRRCRRIDGTAVGNQARWRLVTLRLLQRLAACNVWSELSLVILYPDKSPTTHVVLRNRLLPIIRYRCNSTKCFMAVMSASATEFTRLLAGAFHHLVICYLFASSDVQFRKTAQSLLHQNIATHESWRHARGFQ